MSNLGLFLIAFCCCCLFAATKGEEYSWQARVWTYMGRPMMVQESAEVDVSHHQILMKAVDPKLRYTSLYRTISLHDYQKGLVALKPLAANTCFVGPVKYDFDTTVRELKERSQKWWHARREHRQVKLEAWPSHANTTGSQALDDFCQGRQLVFFQDFDPHRDERSSGVLKEKRQSGLFSDAQGSWIDGPELPCIIGPVDVFARTQDFMLQKDIANFDGLFDSSLSQGA